MSATNPCASRLLRNEALRASDPSHPARPRRVAERGQIVAFGRGVTLVVDEVDHREDRRETDREPLSPWDLERRAGLGQRALGSNDPLSDEGSARERGRRAQSRRSSGRRAAGGVSATRASMGRTGSAHAMRTKNGMSSSTMSSILASRSGATISHARLRAVRAARACARRAFRRRTLIARFLALPPGATPPGCPGLPALGHCVDRRHRARPAPQLLREIHVARTSPNEPGDHPCRLGTEDRSNRIVRVRRAHRRAIAARRWVCAKAALALRANATTGATSRRIEPEGSRLVHRQRPT